MIKKLEEVHDDIVRFIVNNMEAIITEISDAVDSDTSSVEYSHFCEDGSFEILDIYETEEHFCEVRAKGNFHEGTITQTQDGPWPFDDMVKCIFVFYIDIDENGEYRYYIPFNKDGGFDFEEDIVEEP